jgi:chaperonin GroEL
MILGEKDYRKKLEEASQLMADVVGTTFGYLGGNVLLATRLVGKPSITKDGVTVSNFVHSEDVAISKILAVFKQVSEESLKDAGDGTTTSIIIANSIIQSALKIMNKYTSVYLLKKEIDNAILEVINHVIELSVPVESDDIYAIALTSANGDEQIANLVSQAFLLAGNDGYISVTESETPEDSVEVINGFVLDNGYYDEVFLECGKSDILLESPVVHVQETEMSELPNGLIPQDLDKPLLIIAPSFTTQFQATIMKLCSEYKIVLVKIPYITEQKIEIARDIKAYISNSNVKSVLITSKKTIISTEDTSEAVLHRTNIVKRKMEESNDPIEKDHLLKRIQNMNSSSCTIKVGKASTVDYEERLDRFDDSIQAVKSSIVYGYVAGGGTTLNYIAKTHKDSLCKTKGGEIVYHAIQKPMQVLLDNGNVNYNNLELTYGMGVDLKDIGNGTVNLIERSIIDASLVTITALRTSSNVATQLLATKCIIYNE